MADQSKIFSLLKEFLPALAADFSYGMLAGKGHGASEKSGPAGSAASEVGSRLHGRIFGLGHQDEAAILQAISLLSAHEQAMIQARLGSISRHQLKSLRLVIVSLENAEARVTVLKALAAIPEDKLSAALEVVGILADGNFVRAKVRAEELLGKAIQADAAAADKLQSATEVTRGWLDKARAWRARRQAGR